MVPCLDTHEQFMREALKMARTGLDNGELPIGAEEGFEDLFEVMAVR